MQTLELIVTLFIVLWLHHMVFIEAQMKHLTVDYQQIHKIKKTVKNMENNQNIFSQETMEILQVQSNEEAFRLDHRTK